MDDCGVILLRIVGFFWIDFLHETVLDSHNMLPLTERKTLPKLRCLQLSLNGYREIFSYLITLCLTVSRRKVVLKSVGMAAWPSRLW
jgi:hypothetical protein